MYLCMEIIMNDNCHVRKAEEISTYLINSKRDIIDLVLLSQAAYAKIFSVENKFWLMDKSGDI